MRRVPGGLRSRFAYIVGAVVLAGVVGAVVLVGVVAAKDSQTPQVRDATGSPRSG